MPMTAEEAAIFHGDAAVEAGVPQSFEEYASQTLEINHLAEPRDDGETVLSVVFSTETAVGSLLAQLAYFGMSAQLNSEGVLDLIAQGQKNAAVFVLRVPARGGHEAQTNIIVDAAIWSDEKLMAQVNPAGTVLGFHAGLISLARDLIAAGREQAPTHRVLAFITNDD